MADLGHPSTYTPELAEPIYAGRMPTLAELRAWLLETHEVSASEGLLCKTLAELGLTLKKSRSARPNKTALTSLRHGRSGARSSLSLTPAS